VGFKPTITASEQAKTVHARDRSSIVTGRVINTRIILLEDYIVLFYKKTVFVFINEFRERNLCFKNMKRDDEGCVCDKGVLISWH
jgi:hypothetical protein